MAVIVEVHTARVQRNPRKQGDLFKSTYSGEGGGEEG